MAVHFASYLEKNLKWCSDGTILLKPSIVYTFAWSFFTRSQKGCIRSFHCSLFSNNERL